MPWVHLDPAWPRNPKLAKLTRSDRLSWLELLSWSVEHCTDGVVIASDLHRIGIVGQARDSRRLTAALHTAGLLELRSGEPGALDAVYQLHDFDHYQLSAETVDRQREAARERQRRYRSRHGQPSGAQNRKRQREQGGAVTASPPGGVTASPPGGSNAPVPSPPSLTGGEEGKTKTRRKAAARPTGGRSSASTQGSMAESGKLAKELLARIEEGGTAA